MIEIIATTVLIISFSGMLVIFLKKLPVLNALSPEAELPKGNLFLRIKNRTLKFRFFRFFSFEPFLEKFLSKIRILTLKTDKKTSHWLQQIRENNRKKKERENDNYWQEIQKPTKKDQGA